MKLQKENWNRKYRKGPCSSAGKIEYFQALTNSNNKVLV